MPVVDLISSMKCISPADGRYASRTIALSPYFSEYGLIYYRLKVEIEYFKALAEIPLSGLAGISKNQFLKLEQLINDFNDQDAAQIKKIEKTTNHDVKAVEYFLKNKFEEIDLSNKKEFIHFGLTSQDINNTAVPISHKDALQQVVFPEIEKVLKKIISLSEIWQNVVMLARTHGQPASPTRLGKELMVFAERIALQLKQIKQIPHTGKFGGATGNFNAHKVSYPDINWKKFSDNFLKSYLGIERQQTTTQIEHYDHLAAFFQGFMRINNILIDFSRDIWTYISMDYFQQKTIASEVGSSAMPHKVNPIDFENAEGNLGIANALFDHLANKLPISRLQRDLTDSTVLRNIGLPYAHMLIALNSIEKGMEKLMLNEQKINEDLEKNYMVVAEAIQSILRREGIPNPYEQLKELTRGKNQIGKKEIDQFIDSLQISETLKKELRQISPFNYFGY